MSDDRVTRGRPGLGLCRLCAYLAVIGLMVGISATVAAAASGGAGLGGRHGSGGHTTVGTPGRSAQSNPLAGRGMWIWYVSQSNGGNVAAIISRAHTYGIKTLMIKSGDGTNVWSQFSAKLLAQLHAGGLQVCGWQYVYGNDPVTEAHVGATAAKRGADCLLIDAEGEYEGKYVQAQRYITTLRKLVGSRFALGLAGFPYVDYHPAYPYSVFMGPGGAQYNVPQMYWVDIQTTVDSVYAHTYLWNRIYQRALYPLGQVYNSPPSGDIVRFRRLSLAYGAGGVSWWDWQEAGTKWHALGQPISRLINYTPSSSIANLGRGDAGDYVVWAQQHLVGAGQNVPVDGSYGSRTESAVKRLQAASGVTVTGRLNTVTWQLLLRYPPVRVHWTKHAPRFASTAGAGSDFPVPKSATLPAIRNELRGAPGRGGSPR